MVGEILVRPCRDLMEFTSLELDIPPHMVPPNPDDSDSLCCLTIHFDGCTNTV